MAYDERLAARVRKSLATCKGIAEKKMFGGLAFLMGGRMCCGVLNDDLVVRIGSGRYATALSRPHARPMDFTGRPITGFLYVGPRGIRTGAALSKWLREATDYAASLPRGKGGSKRRRGTRPRD